MMDLVRSWLLGVTGVAIFTAMAEGLMPEGSVKQVGKLTGGLVLLVVALTPILSLNLEGLFPVEQWEHQLATSEEELEEGRKNQWEGLIVEELETYIVDKGAERGISCTAEVSCRWSEEIYLPDEVVISGNLTEGEREQLRQLIEEDFSISAMNILFVEEEVS